MARIALIRQFYIFRIVNCQALQDLVLLKSHLTLPRTNRVKLQWRRYRRRLLVATDSAEWDLF